MKYLFFLSVLSMSLFACMKIKDKDQDSSPRLEQERASDPTEEPQIPDPPGPPIKDKLLSVRVDPLPEPYQYEAKIFVEYAKDPLLIRKTEIQTSQSWILKYQPQTILNDSVISGKTYSYEVLSPSLAEEVVDRLQITIPQDFVLSGNAKTPAFFLDAKLKQSLEKSKRIFLENLSLDTQGRDLTIQADELIVHKTTIYTFPPKAKAKANQIGRPGGRIVIQAKKAKGSLRVELRGEDGGEGSKGKSQPPAKPGADGKAYFTEDGRKKICKVTAPAGKGANGLPGGNGLDGRPGGATGSLVLKTEEEEGFDLRVERFQGTGGAGGIGGEGGDGGLGGQHGPGVLIQHLCASRNGADGKKGASGLNGRAALPGAVELICVKRAWDQEANCY